jgi:hypothetical protein
MIDPRPNCCQSSNDAVDPLAEHMGYTLHMSCACTRAVSWQQAACRSQTLWSSGADISWVQEVKHSICDLVNLEYI